MVIADQPYPFSSSPLSFSASAQPLLLLSSITITGPLGTAILSDTSITTGLTDIPSSHHNSSFHEHRDHAPLSSMPLPIHPQRSREGHPWVHGGGHARAMSVRGDRHLLLEDFTHILSPIATHQPDHREPPEEQGFSHPDIMHII